MATIDEGKQLDLPRADPGEPVDILTFVVTEAGWKAFKDRLGIDTSNPIRILTRLLYPSAIPWITQLAKAEWRWSPTNHAKVILYHWQKLAVLGSFNLTGSSLGNNIECASRVDADYDRLLNLFNEHWNKASREHNDAIATREAILSALETMIAPLEDEPSGQTAASNQTEFSEDRLNPHPYQETIIEQVIAWLDGKSDSDLGQIVTLPTGAGKTLIGAEVIRRLLENKPYARILWVCHRVELLRQSWESCRRQLNGSIHKNAWFIPQHIKDDLSPRNREEFRRSPKYQLVFCTRGMLHHLLRQKQKPFDLTIVDECHRFHPESTQYKKLHTYCLVNEIPRLGLTATPLRSDKRRFGRYWSTEVMYGQDVTRESLEQHRFLSRINQEETKPWQTDYRFRFKDGERHDESTILTRIGEFDNPQVNGAVKEAWEKYRDLRKRVLCFAVTIEHAKTLKERYFVGDDCVQMLQSELSPKEIRRAYDWFREPSSESRMLVSVLMLAEGIDLPQVDCLFMVRPTFSPELHQQMLGRGLRGPKAGGTEDCAVVDFTYQFVSPNGELRQWTTGNDDIGLVGADAIVSEEDADPEDDDSIWTVGELRQEVAELQENGMTVQEACEELAQELGYASSTLLNYVSTKHDNYQLEMADSQSAGAEGYVTRDKLLDLRSLDPRCFGEIARLTDVAASTLRSYCSDLNNFRRWKVNNEERVDQVRTILTDGLARNRNAA